MSSRTRSGRSSAVLASASVPSAASPTTENPSASSSARAVARKLGWSSTTRTVLGTSSIVASRRKSRHTASRTPRWLGRGTPSGRDACGGGCRGASGRRGPLRRPFSPPRRTGPRRRARWRSRTRTRGSPPRDPSDLREREAAMAPGRDKEVLPVRRPQHRVEALVAVAWLERQRPVRKHAVHREAVAVEVVARRVEDDEVDAGSGTGHELGGLIRELEGVVERVEVRADRNGGSLRVARAVWPDLFRCEPRRNLDRRAVADAAGAREVAPDVRLGLGLLRALRHGLHVRLHLEARPER